MNVPNIANQGSVGQTRDRAGDRVRPEKTVLIPAAARDETQDRAMISDGSRDALAAITGLAERARAHGADRSATVETARAKLLSGELGTDHVIAATAHRIADSGFLAD